MRKTLSLAAALGLLASASALAQSGTITGRVVDEGGEPLNRATIRVVGTQRGGFSTTNGSFRIANVPVGTWDIKISFAGKLDEVRQRVRVGLDQVVDMGTISLSAKARTVVVVGKADEKNVRVNPGKVDTKTGEQILLTSRGTQNVLNTAALSSSASTTQGSLAIRGMRSTDLSLRVDGVEQADLFSGGTGSGNLTPSNLGIEEMQVQSSGTDASKGNAFGGGVELVTRRGKSNRYEGAVQWVTPVEFLFGSSNPITVKKAGTDVDTTLPGYKLKTSGTQRYEFFFGGPVPGIGDIVTFSLSGKVVATPGGGGYDILDMSPEFAARREAIADRVWGYHLNPTSLAELPNGQSLARQFNAKFNITLSDMIALELSGELGLQRNSSSDWTHYYMYDTSRVSGTPILENIAQNVSSNETKQRIGLRYTQTLDDVSFFDVGASYYHKSSEVGKRDMSKEYGFFDQYDIYGPDDENGDGIIDRYYSAPQDVYLNDQIRRFDSINNDPGRNTSSIPAINPLTGFIENGENPGASHDPYGLIDGTFPAHGNDRALETRDQTEIGFRGNYETTITIADSVETLIKAGGEFSLFTLRRHSNSLPWDADPFFDVYGFESPYFQSDSTGRLAAFYAEPFKPLRGAAFLQTRFGYKQIYFSPSVRFEFVLPNTKVAPPANMRSTVKEIVDQFDTLSDAPMKFAISPRLGVSYPITDASTFRVNFAMAYKFPEFNLMYDGALNTNKRGNQIFGNPDIKPQKSLIYEIGFNTTFAPNFSLDLSAFYRDIYNQTGLTFIPALPAPFTIYTVSEYGNVRGLEATIRRNLANNFFAELNYTLQQAVGTASNPGANYSALINAVDPFTGERELPALVEYPLSYDQTHKINLQAGAVWGRGEGPAIAGVNLLENTTISFTASYGTGLPYTRFNERGAQISEYNSLRFPAAYSTEMHIERGIPLGGIFGDSASTFQLSFFVDIFNVLNQTGPSTYYTTTSSPNTDGTSLDRQLGDFPGTTYFADIVPERPETWSTNQYDNFGRRYYNPYADVNLDGEVTSLERYEGYQRLVATIQSQQRNYYQPRTVQFGVRLKF